MKITELEANWIRESIKKVDFLSLLTPSQIDELITQVTPRILMGNQPVILEGQEGENFFFIYNGRVSIKVVRNKKTVKLANLNKGDYFGEISLLTGQPAIASVTALAPTKVFFLHSDQFINFVRSNPNLAKHIVQVMQKRMKEHKKAVESLQYKNINEINTAIKDFLAPQG